LARARVSTAKEYANTEKHSGGSGRETNGRACHAPHREEGVELLRAGRGISKRRKIIPT